MIKKLFRNVFFAAILVVSGVQVKAQSNNVRGIYVSGISTWIGNTSRENEVLTYAQANNFNYLTLYDLGSFSWTSTTQKNLLAAFIRKAKTSYGITQIGAAGEIYSFFADYIVPYNSSRTSSSERFDVFNYEFEFWVNSSISSLYCSRYLSPQGYSCDTAGAFKFAMKNFKRIDSLAAARGAVSEVYFGWPNAGQIQQFAALADRILLHAYRTDDSDVYQYSRNRLINIAGLGRSIKILPIFSSEPDFMGPWLQTNPQSKPYQTYSNYYTNETGSFKQFINLQGYQWFNYRHMPTGSTSSSATATITPSGTTTFCTGGSVTLTANSGSQYLWSPGGQTTRSITVSSSGSYTVRVTNSSGVNATSSPVVVSVTSTGTTPTVTTSGPTSFCQGASVTLTSSSADSYLWSTGETTRSITVTSSGSYTVRATTGSCSATSSAVSVNANSAPAVPTISSSGSLNICPGTSITLTSSQANGYLWSTGETTRSIVVNSAGTYSVRAYAGPNCSARSTNTVTTMLTAPATPTISVTGPTTLSSSQPSTTLTSSSASAYNWSTGSSTRSIVVTNQGSYRVTVTGSNGCKLTSSAVNITANGCTPPPMPTITLSQTSNVIMAGNSITLTCSLAGGYLWSTGATTRSINVTQPGTYTVRAYSAGYCFSTSLPQDIILISTKTFEATNTILTNSFSAFPNPATENVSFIFDSSIDNEYIIHIVDLTGRELRSQDVQANAGTNKIEMNISDLPSGLYFAYLSNGIEKYITRLIVE